MASLVQARFLRHSTRKDVGDPGSQQIRVMQHSKRSNAVCTKKWNWNKTPKQSWNVSAVL